MSKLEKYTTYKDSGVEWLGKIPEHWGIKKLKHALKFTTGGTPSSGVEDYYNGEEPWVTIADMTGRYIEKSHFISKKAIRECNMQIVPKDSLLYSFKLSVGQVAFTTQNTYTNEAIASFYPANNIDLNFWYYVLPVYVIRNANKNIYGAYLLNQDLIKNATIIFPPKEEQTKIASYLDGKTAQIDKAISQKEKLIELLKEQKQITINEAVTKGLNKDVEFKDSAVEWLGQVPNHWDVIKVKNIFNLIIDPAPKANNEELLSIYTDIGVKPRKELEEKGNKASTTDGYWRVKKGDFIVNKLLAWMGAIGLSEYEGVTSPAYDILRAKVPIVGRFYHELFRLKVFSEEMKKHSRGIMEMRLRLYFDKFGDILVPYPPKDEQVQIVEYIENQTAKIDKAIELQQNYISRLKEYKASLIDSVVTGKVRVA